MSDFTINCPKCGVLLEASDAHVGLSVACPSCDAPIQVSRPIPDAPPKPETKDCPYCGEEILFKAKKCKHCGEFLTKDKPATDTTPSPQKKITVPKRKSSPPSRSPSSAPKKRGTRCPKCGSTNIQVGQEGSSKGFGAGKGCLGTILFGPIGFLCGLCGMGKGKTKSIRMCVDCGKKL